MCIEVQLFKLMPTKVELTNLQCVIRMLLQLISVIQGWLPPLIESPLMTKLLCPVKTIGATTVAGLTTSVWLWLIVVTTGVLKLVTFFVLETIPASFWQDEKSMNGITKTQSIVQ